MRFYKYLNEEEPTQPDSSDPGSRLVKTALQGVGKTALDLAGTYFAGDLGKDISNAIQKEFQSDPNFKSTEKTKAFSATAKQLWKQSYLKKYSELFAQNIEEYNQNQKDENLFDAAFTKVVMDLFEVDGDILRYYYHKDLMLAYLKNSHNLKLQTPYSNFTSAGILDSEEIDSYIKKHGMKSVVNGYLGFLYDAISSGNIKSLINNMKYKPTKAIDNAMKIIKKDMNQGTI